MIEAITSKPQLVQLFVQGFFGNRVRQWQSVRELMSDPFDRLVVLRQKSRQGGGRGITIYGIEKSSLPAVVAELARKGIEEETLYFNEAIIPANVVFQGEIMRIVGGLYLLYSTLPMHMHDALLKEPKHAFGLRAKLLMEHFVCDYGLPCIWDLLERFENHVVEFTVCSKSFGDLSWRTIIWECRGF